MSPIVLDYAPRTEFDTGRFVARYLQVLAWVSIASMIAGPIFFRSINVDLSPIFMFWAASALKRRSQTARILVLAIGGLMLTTLVGMLLWALIAGTDRMAVSFGTGSVKNPALWQVVAVVVLIAGVVSVPLGVLVSARARRQFAGGTAGT